MIPKTAFARIGFSLAVSVFLATTVRANAADDCVTIHGRARFYCGDGQLRIWHVGTHHEFEPDETSWDRVITWLEEGVKEPNSKQDACTKSDVDLFADFEICPTEPLRPGAVQHAVVKTAIHRHYVPVR